MSLSKTELWHCRICGKHIGRKMPEILGGRYMSTEGYLLNIIEHITMHLSQIVDAVNK